MQPALDMLFVDDDAVDVALFTRAVAKADFNIRLQALAAGQEAINYLEAKGKYADRSMHPLPDVIVLDLKMPQLSGFDFLTWRKVTALFLAIPVLIFSGSASPSEISRVFALGANKHILKPHRYEDWEKVIREICAFACEGTAFFRRRDVEAA